MRRSAVTLGVVPAFLAALLLMAGCGAGATHTPSGAPSSPSLESPAPAPSADSAIAWSEAASRIGETLTVEGPVMSVTAGAGSVPTVLNVGLDAPDTARFVALIPAKIAAGLSSSPVDYFDGALVRVTGKIVPYEGASAVEVKAAKDIQVQH